MGFGLSKTRCSPIGIDFGADALKLLQVVPGQPSQLIAAATETLPEEARHDPAERQRLVGAALRRLLKAAPFKGRRTVCSLPAFQTLIQHLEIAAPEDADLATQIDLQLRERMNVDPDRMVVRHFPMGQVVREGQNCQEVLVLAASREVVMRYVDLLKSCKLEVVGMPGEPSSILRAFAQPESDDGRAVCFIDIGAVTTKVVIAHGSKMVFAKTIHAAGDHITRAIAKRDGLSFDEARARRIAEAAGVAPTQAPAPTPTTVPAESESTGLPALDAQPGTTTAAAGDAAPADADTIECVTDELQLSLRYHQRLYPSKPIEKLVFLGGESKHTHVCQTIARSVRIAAQLGDPLARLNKPTRGKAAAGVDLGEPQPGWAVPLGLCLSEADM